MSFSLFETDSSDPLKLRMNSFSAASTSSVVAACSKIAVVRSSDPRAQAAHHYPSDVMLNIPASTNNALGYSFLAKTFAAELIWLMLGVSHARV